MNKRSQGTNANYTGKQLEEFIKNQLDSLGYRSVDKRQFSPALYLEQPIYAQQFYPGQSIYGTSLFCDFIVYHPEKWPMGLWIEAKWQQSGGSVDEKYPYLVANLKKYPDYRSIIVLDGGGYKPGAEAWLRDQTDDVLLHIFNMSQFQIWTNKGNL